MTANVSTYSFQEVIVTFTHPLVGVQSTNGQGIGSISLTYDADKTAHQVADDGSIMVSYIPGHNGKVAMQMQQTSSLNQFLLNYYNTIKNTPKAVWAAATITVTSPNTVENHICTGVSPSKPADKPYAAQGQMITWNFMAADISQASI